MKGKSRAMCIRCCRYLIVPTFFLVWGCLLFPQKIHYTSYLVPAKDRSSEGYEIGDKNTVSYYIEGSRIDVRYVTDQELNETFPDDSRGGKLSTNPYTYGDWVDPNMGYTPNRFTVFEVGVYNYTLPKMMLDPTKAILLTDRGELLSSYTAAPMADRKSLEGYYRALRRISGNEYYRFAKRIGVVRSTVYGEHEIIFKGENYKGFIVFDPLHLKAQKMELVLKDFAVKFDAFNRPTQTVDIPFHFERRMEKYALREEQVKDEQQKTRAVIHGPKDMSGNQPGDVARDVGAVNSVVSENLMDLNRCFSTEFGKGQALEGEVVVEFVILVNGEVSDVKLVESTVSSEVVERCILEEVNGWRFQPAGRFAIESPAPTREQPGALTSPEVEPGAPTPQPRSQPVQQRASLLPVKVVYPFQFVEMK